MSGDCDELSQVNKQKQTQMLVVIAFHSRSDCFSFRWENCCRPDFLKVLAKRPPDWWSTSFINTLDQWYGVEEYGKINFGDNDDFFYIFLMFTNKFTNYRKSFKDLFQNL